MKSTSGPVKEESLPLFLEKIHQNILHLTETQGLHRHNEPIAFMISINPAAG